MMDFKQDLIELHVGVFKTEPVETEEENDSLSRKLQMCKNEQDVFSDTLNNFEKMSNLVNLDVIKQEVIECEVPKIEPSSVYLPKIDHDSVLENVQCFPTTIKKELENISEVKATYIDIKKDIEYVQTKIESELLTSYCDLPTLKNENIDIPDYYFQEPCSSKLVGTLNPLKNTANVLKTKRRKYMCPVCQKYFLSSNSRSKHINGHFRNRLVVCVFCGKLMKKNEIFRHYFIHLVKKRTNKLFQKINKVSKIKIICRNNIEQKSNTKKHACDKKLKQFNLKSKLQRCTREKAFKCDVCSKVFTRKYNLRQHLIIHTNGKQFTCDICSRIFTRKYNLQQHLIIHANKKPFKCEICFKQFSHKDRLRQHLITHTNEKQFKCDRCFERFTQKSDLQQHLITHTKKKPFKCDICSKVFTRKFNLRQHLITHTNGNDVLQQHLIVHTNERAFKCNICSTDFKVKYSLQKHLISHANEKPFKCNICSKGFTHKCYLQRHIIIHTDEKPFNCDICLQCFNNKSSLQKHLLRHNKANTFKCDICSKRFTQISRLQQHLITHANKKSKKII